MNCQLCGAPARFRTNIKVWLCDRCCHAAQVLAVAVVNQESQPSWPQRMVPRLGHEEFVEGWS